MINIQPRLRRQFRPAQQASQAIGLPAPVSGILATAPVYGDQSSLNYSIYSYNMIPGEYGLRVRKGSYYYAENILDKDAAAGEVRSVMDYVAPDGTTKKFAANNEGIWEITGGGTGTWTKVYDFATENVDTGYCKWLQYTNTGGTHYLLVCDEANGYITFDGTTWAAGSTTGVSAADLVDITEHQGRLVFVERDSGNVWYLAPLAVSGTATQFEMGTRFRHGGHVKQITTWTINDAAGLDDKFIVLGEGGDVLVWAGDLDTSALLEGRWYVGAVPKGRRVMSEWGGDVILLTARGALQLTVLVGGMADIRDDAYVTKNIERQFRALMRTQRTSYGWSAVMHPADGIAIFTTPKETSMPGVQFVYDLTSQAWGMFRDLDMLCATDSQTGLFFGTRTGQVVQYTGTVDNVPNDSSTSDPISFSILSHYSPLGLPGKRKRCQFIRPIFLGDAVPTYGVQARYDYDLTEADPGDAFIPGTIALWDSAVWDAGVWGGLAQSYQFLNGGKGMGHHVAVALVGETTVDLNLIGYDFIYDSGGLL